MVSGMSGNPDIWFTGDTHFGHVNLLRYVGRPFKDVQEHDEELIRRWNDRVKPGDLVYHLGDFGMPQGFEDPRGYLMSIKARLNGQVHFIRGNHDKLVVGGLLDMFVTDRLYHTVKVKDADARGAKQHVIVCHYPFETWNQSHYGSWHCHAHCHGNLKDDAHKLRADVGVDCWSYAPVSYDEVKAHMATKTFKPVDHHGRR